MFFEVTAIVLFLVYLVAVCIDNFGNSHRPPGPFRIPLFGNMIQMLRGNPLPHIALHNLAKKYGDIMSIKMGPIETVILSSSEVVRNIFTKEEATGRVCFGFLWERNFKQNLGLLLGEGDEYNEIRKFCRETLKAYGYKNRESMQNLVLEELNSELLKSMEEDASSNSQRIVHFDSEYFHKSFLNIITTLIMGKRFEYNDPNFKVMLKYSNDIARNDLLGAGLLVTFPFLRYVLPTALGYTALMGGIRGIQEVAMNHFNGRKTKAYKTVPNCLTDHFLQELDKKNSLFSENQFAVLFTDFVQAGTETTSNVINFILLHITSNQKIQEKIYQEIVDVIGLDRVPDIENKFRMTYTQAVILEGLRWSRILVLGAPRKATRDFTYGKYLIKKGTVLMSNLHSIFFNESVWGDPLEFRPERFFDDAGQLDSKRVEIVQVVFGAGKRVCFGEVLARDSLFLFVTSLVQQFEFTLPPGPKPQLEPGVGMTLYPHAYNAILTPRKSVQPQF